MSLDFEHNHVMESVSPQRRRSSTAVHLPDEILNIRSEERTNLLSELKEVIRVDQVKAPLWACLQVCNLAKLHEFISEARAAPQFFSVLQDTFLQIPLRWMQRSPRDYGQSSASATSSSSAISSTRIPRLNGPSRLAKERDGHVCVLTGKEGPQAAHIFPHSMINSKNPNNLSNSIPDFWKSLDLFFEPDRLDQWRYKIFQDPTDPAKVSDGCHNRICLSPETHDYWTKGLFALRPIFVSLDRKSLTVQFYWQPRQTHRRFESVDLLKEPPSSSGLAGIDRVWLTRWSPEPSGEIIRIKSGDTFILKTHNPDTHPLPSFELLEMQWHLNRVVSMSAAAEIFDEEDDDDDEGFDTREIHQTSADILPWIPAPPSSDSTDDDSDGHNFSMTTASSNVSPAKVREQQSNVISASTEVDDGLLQVE